MRFIQSPSEDGRFPPLGFAAGRRWRRSRRTLREFTPTRIVARTSSQSLTERGGDSQTEDDTEANGEELDEGRHGG